MHRARPGRRGRCSDRGAMAVEFGIFAPILGLLVAGVVYFGFAFHIQITLTSAAREGVRVYALGSGDPVSTTQNAATSIPGPVGVSASGCPDPLSPGNPPANAEVTATFTYQPGFAFLPSLPISGRAIMRCGG